MILYNIVTTFVAAILIATALAGKVTNPSKVPKNAVLLSDVSSLTLRDGKLTSARRGEAFPQLECVGPKEICDLYRVDMMRCTNEGADYDKENIQWSCKASLPEEFKLGSTDVVCEGYESSEDPYVLKGSCAVEYRLLLTNKGQRKYSYLYQKNQKGPAYGTANINAPSGTTQMSASTIVFFIIFAVVLVVILKGIWSQSRRNPPRLRGPRPDWGGNTDNNDDPPPPYDDSPPFYSQPRKPKTQTVPPRGSTSTNAGSSRSASQRDQGSQTWRPGFWTGTAAGTAAGAAAGYYAGSRAQARSETQQSRVPPQPETQEAPEGFFSNFGSSRHSTQPRPAPPSPVSSNSTPTYSSTRHESTGFGGTRRR